MRVRQHLREALRELELEPFDTFRYVPDPYVANCYAVRVLYSQPGDDPEDFLIWLDDLGSLVDVEPVEFTAWPPVLDASHR